MAFANWEWALVGMLGLGLLWRTKAPGSLLVSTVAVSVFWLAAFYWTGDRRLFFPYTMQFGVQTRGGPAIVALFLLIRIAQAATPGVLIVELLVALAILAVVPLVRSPRLAGPVASVLALAGLAL